MTVAIVPAKKTAWSDFRLRAISALVLAPLALTAIWVGGVAWIALLAIGFTGLTVEWVQLCGRPALSPTGLAPVLVVLAAGLLAVAGQPRLGLLLLAGGALAVGLWSQALAWGVPYVGVAAVALVWLRGADALGRENLVFLVLVVWTTDIGAYVVGRLLGGPKLAPRTSPGKTWSGAAGGLAAAMLLAPAAAWLLAGAPPPGLLPVAVAAVLSVVAQAGDLVESGIKRRFGVKDSGWLIPGHGGLLDRLDGLLAAAPAAALLAASVGRGVLL